MIIPIIHEIAVIGVADRGVPNKERVLLRPHVAINLQNFVLGIGWAVDGDTKIIPLPNFVFYFNDILVPSMCWVIVYTGGGTTEISRLPTTNEPAYSLHWGQPAVLFGNPLLMPVLFKVAAIAYPEHQLPGLLPQAKQQPRLVGN